RAKREARRLSCAALDGITNLIEADDLHAVLLCDPQWFGLWPLELACRFGKPVLCCVPLARDDAHADALVGQVRNSRLPVLVELLPRLAPVEARLHELLQKDLGPVRFVRAEVIRSRSPARSPSLLGAYGIAQVDWCCRLLEGEPTSTQ